MKCIAIVGAGLAGLASAWQLLGQDYDVTIFDESIGAKASGIAAGLMHPYAGMRAKLAPFAEEGMKATKELLDTASKTLGKPVYKQEGLLRIAKTPEQRKDYALCEEKFEDVVKLSESEFFVKSAYTIDCPLYLKGLFKACQQKGLKWEAHRVKVLSDLDCFSHVIITAGANVNDLVSIEPLSFVKGQVLEFLHDLSTPINSQAYAIPTKENTCLVGATYERGYKDAMPDLEKAKQELIPKIIPYLPSLEGAPIINCRAGIRVFTPNYMPRITQVENNVWVYTGLGSKGLLYHALFAKLLLTKLTYSSISDG